MKITPVDIPGLLVISPDVYHDNRGFFMESYHEERYFKQGLTEKFVQDNHAGSIKNVLRGLHYQTKHAQGKLIRAIQGEVFDVAIDIRRGSATFGKWFGIHLSAENHKQLYIPADFAHGYCAMSEYVEIQYKCTEKYYPSYDAGIRWDDPDIGINWPVSNPILSKKDEALPYLNQIIFEEQ